jgi:hypothetical protein
MRNLILAGFLVFGATASAQEMPTDQQAFRDVIVTAREAYDAATNDLAKGGQRPKRAEAICEVVPSKKIKDWTGTVYDLSTNGDGLGVLSIEMEGDIWISTWNNALSDISYDTLIDSNSDLFSALAELSEGQQVIFSGSFFKEDQASDCYKEKSMSMSGSMSQPEFVFDFSSVTPAP